MSSFGIERCHFIFSLDRFLVLNRSTQLRHLRVKCKYLSHKASFSAASLLKLPNIEWDSLYIILVGCISGHMFLIFNNHALLVHPCDIYDINTLAIR